MTDQQLEANFKVINDRLDKIEKAQGNFSTDMAKDRGDLHDFTLELARQGAMTEAVFKLIKSLAQKIGEKVEEAVEPMIDSAEELTEAIEKKKVTLKVRQWWHLWG